ncbi:MAG: DUF4397 domain-containing protein [Anaerolineae bacterium]|nr:DUF4397 domain-containing protein [Anaerolineae bacterium]MDW8173922.1 hypothetical protein [Anaerolineae bacterium]
MRRDLCLFAGLLLAMGVLAQAQPPSALSFHPPQIERGTIVNFFQFAHTSVDVGSLDIYLDGVEEPIIRNMAYGDTVPMMAIPAAKRTFVARRADTGSRGAVLASTDIDFGTNASWLLLAAGRDERRSFDLLPVPIPRSAALYRPGQAFVRSLSAVSDGSSMSIAIESSDPDVKAGGRASLETSMGWLSPRDNSVAAGDYLISARASGTPFAPPQNIRLEAEKTTMLIIIGSLSGAPPGQILALTSPPEQARVKLVNEQNDDYTVVFSPVNLQIDALDAGQSSDFVTVRSSNVRLLFFLKGANLRQSPILFEVPQRLRPGRDLVITLRADGSVDVEETLTPPE